MPPSTSDGAGKGHDTESTANEAETDKEATAANERPPKPSIKQALLAPAVFAAAIVTIILLAFSWPTVTSEPERSADCRRRRSGAD